MKGYLSVQETASKWGVSVRWVNQYILEGRISGCERFGRVWAVPEDAVKSKRLTPGVKAKRSSSAQNLSFLPGRELKRNDAYAQYSLYRKLRDEAQELVIAENNPERLFASVGSEVQHQQSQCEESAKQIL